MANPALERLSEGSFAARSGNVVTLNSVMEKTFITVGLMVLSAIATWLYASNLIETENADSFGTLAMAAGLASMACFGLSLWISFKAKTSAGLIMLFSALEGVSLGFISKVISAQVGSVEPVVGAIVGTFVAMGVTLAAYRFFNIQVTPKFNRWLTIGIFSFIGVGLVDFVLSFFGASVGLNGFGVTGALFSAVGVVLAIFMLMSDFDAVENAIAYGAPEKYSWSLAFGLTVTIVWLYINLLKILAYFQSE